MHVTIHYLMRRDLGKLFKVVKSDNIIRPHQGHSSVILHAGINLLLAFSPCPASLHTRSNLFHRSCKRSNPSSFKSKNGQNYLKNLLLNDSYPPLANAGKGLVLLSLHISVISCLNLVSISATNNTKRNQHETRYT